MFNGIKCLSYGSTPSAKWSIWYCFPKRILPRNNTTTSMSYNPHTAHQITLTRVWTIMRVYTPSHPMKRSQSLANLKKKGPHSGMVSKIRATPATQITHWWVPVRPDFPVPQIIEKTNQTDSIAHGKNVANVESPDARCELRKIKQRLGDTSTNLVLINIFYVI